MPVDISKGRLAVGGIALLTCIVGLFAFTGNNNINKASQQNLIKENNNNISVTAADKSDEKAETVVVQISGEVKSPDVYELDEGSRLKDLVDKAGGFTEDAYTDNLNLAERLEDEKKYVVYSSVKDIDKIEALEQNIPKETENADNGNKLININTADAQTLKQLDGIGDTLAERIIEYRNSCGDFSSIDEIREVEGIGEGIYNEIKDGITIDD
jgi:competence protein ComEA